MNLTTRIVTGLLPLALVGTVHAEFLFAPENGNFINPTFNRWDPVDNPGGSYARYSEWRNFYSKHTYGNLPDYYAEFGGEVIEGYKYSTPRPEEDPDFPYHNAYIAYQPNAFWDTRNPTITQTSIENGAIVGGENKNFYSQSGTQYFRLDDDTANTSGDDLPSYTTNTIVFQFQTDGMVIDLDEIILIYTVNGVEYSIKANDLGRAEYLREYRLPEGTSSNPNASQGYLNRSAIQWDLSGLNYDSYRIEWTLEAHTSFHQAALDTSAGQESGIPTSRTWRGGNGDWSNPSLWTQYTSSGLVTGTGPLTNGNVRFENATSASIDLTTNHTLGELIFTSEENATISSSNGSRLISNTGISTTAAATGEYTINTNFQLAALNLFNIEAGKVTMNGVISGAYALVKSGEGELVLSNNNTFTQFLDLQGGKLRLEGTNAYTGRTQLRWGELTIATANASAALGSHSQVLLGASSSFSNPGDAALFLDGGLTFTKDIALNTGNFRRIIGARNTGAGGATYSGNILYSATSSDVRLRAEGVNDILNFTGQIDTTASRSSAIIIDGQGKVVFSGAAKKYHQATTVASGTLIVDTTIMDDAFAGHVTVKNGATLELTSNGALQGTGGGFGPNYQDSFLILESGSRLTGSGTVTRHTQAAAGSTIAATQGEKLTLYSLNVASGVNFEFSLDNPSSVAMEMTGALTVGAGTLNFTFNVGEDFVAGTVYDLFTFASISGFTGDYSIFQLSPGSGLALDTSFGTNGWNFDGNTLQVALIPEPTTSALLIGAGLALFANRRRRA